MTITVTERVGKCRWCGCTDEHGCDVGCSWANRHGTLCSECVELDRLMRSVRGRQAVAEIYRDSERLSLS
jgi:hypothetical protein